MIDAERRKFLKMGLKLITFSGTLAATYPLQSIYAGKVRPSLIGSFQKEEIPKKIDFSLMDSVVPQILASSAIMTFIMMHADSLQILLSILIFALVLFSIGIPITEMEI